MNNKRSYLDTLNQGRERRPGATIEQITQSLQNLESRLDRSRDDSGDPRQNAANPHSQRPAFSPLPMLKTRETALSPSAHQSFRPSAAAAPYQSLANDLDRIRGQEDGIASVSRIAGEIKSLRDDLRQQLASNLQQEFATLRDEIGQTLASTVPTAVGAELASEVERISRGMRDLSDRADDNGVGLLRGEIEQVRLALETLTRDEPSDHRWDEFDRRWTDFENRIDARQPVRDPEISTLSERLSTISEAVGNLPESLSLRSLEERVRTLASAIEQFVRQQEHQAPETFRLIEERLDEISRAIVASTAAASAPHVDPEPFQRIEARMAALARQIEEVVEDRSTAEVIERLGTLSQRVDELAARGQLPEQAMERLAKQIFDIARKIDRQPLPLDADRLFTGIEQRFESLSSMIERRQGDAIEQGNLMFRDLERRLDEVAERMDVRSAESIDQTTVMRTIDARFSKLADQLISHVEADATGQAIHGLESRLETISARLDASSRQLAEIDPNLIRSLQGQVAALTDHLSRPAAPLPELEDLGPRLEDIERSIAGSRDSILDAARQAAENAVRSFDGSQTHTAAVTGLSEDLKALEALTRRSDERNAKTFGAIHDTLIKIVDRLTTLDSVEPDEAVAPRGLLDATPPLQMEPADSDRMPPAAAPSRTVGPAQGARSPAEAAMEAAVAASASDIAPAQPGQKTKSLLGGFVRALAKKEQPAPSASTERVQPVLSEPAAPTLDAPLDPKIANRPLEPGSGAPDLDAIMKRVRDERGQAASPSGEPDAAKSDFIAAARRAAKAAAAEAELLKRNAVGAKHRPSLKLAGAMKAKRKPILMAATGILVVLICVQLGRIFLGGDSAPEVAIRSDNAAPAADATAPAAAPAPVEADAVARNVVAPPAGPPSAMVASAPIDGSGPEAIDPKAGESEPADTATATTGESPTAMKAAAPVVPPEAVAATQVLDAPAASPQPMTAAPLAAETPAPAATTPVPDAVPVEAGPVALREAAEAGDAKALFEVASRFAEGRGTKVDMKQAAKWYEKSADLGFAPAQYRAGNFYEKAIGVGRDLAKAKTLYQRASEQGNASAMHNLAVLFATGGDGQPDNESANRWFTKAADLGVKDSQFNLGILAAKGVGMPQNLEESYKWFALVAKSGDRDAAAKRDEIANALRPEQLQKARSMVELWKAQPLDPEANSVEIPESWQESGGTTASVDMKKAVGNIQRILNKNGYDAGGTDGVMGLKTKNAIKAFQKDNDLAQTGTVDEKLVKALLARK